MRNHGGQDICSYDVIKDVGRVEADMQILPECNGAVIVLANDTSYWTRPGHNLQTNAAAFRVYESSHITGTLAWGPKTGPGTLKGRESPIWLTLDYQLTWRGY
jgi:hypothetical protein